MPLEGLRAWIGEVERKLGMRTRVFLVLSVIALGGAGAAIYLAVDAREDSVRESDVQALQQKLEAQIAGDGAAAPATPEEPATPAPESGSTGATGATGPTDTGGATGLTGAEAAKLKDFLEGAKEQAGK